MASAAETVQQFYEAAWTRGDLDAGRALLADDLIDHDAMPFPGRAAGADGLLQVVAMIRSALPDLARRIDLQVVDGDLVATRFTDRGTHRGELLGITPTGRQVSVAGINIERVRDGRITEVWHVEDLAGLMRQVG